MRAKDLQDHQIRGIHQIFASAAVMILALSMSACNNAAANTPQAMTQAMPVKVVPVVLAPVAKTDTYVSTIKSRRSATIQPQVEGNIIKINVHSGDQVRQGDVLMEIDPQKQLATVQAARATEQQLLAVYQYNEVQVERQRNLFAEGIISRDSSDQAEQAFKNSKASYDSAVASRATQEAQLSYYHVTAPFDGVVGDIPVVVGDYVSPTSSSSSILTTVDANNQLEVYIYIPAERAAQVRKGLPVEILDDAGNVVERTNIDFISPQVDNGLQSILAKAPVHSTQLMLRNSQLIKARVTWSNEAAPLVPVLAVTRIGGQSFVYVAQAAGNGYVAHQTTVQLGDTQGNSYAVLQGLKPGDKVIVSGTQMLAEGAPVQPMG